jgi:hypothetical protein
LIESSSFITTCRSFVWRLVIWGGAGVFDITNHRVVAFDRVAANRPSTSNGGPKPILEQLGWLDAMPPPPTVADMVSAAMAVIVATYTGAARLVEQTFEVAPPLRKTAYSFRLERVVKPHQYLPFVGEEVEFELVGGDKEYPTYVSRERPRDTNLLSRGHTYVLFLGRYAGEFDLNWGGYGGVYDITGRQVIPLDRNLRQHDGPVEPFLAALDAAATQQ